MIHGVHHKLTDSYGIKHVWDVVSPNNSCNLPNDLVVFFCNTVWQISYFVKFGIISPIFWLNIPKTSPKTPSSSYLIIDVSFDDNSHVEGILIRKIPKKSIRVLLGRPVLHFSSGTHIHLDLWVSQRFQKKHVPQQSSPLHLNKKDCSFWNHQKLRVWFQCLYINQIVWNHTKITYLHPVPSSSLVRLDPKVAPTPLQKSKPVNITFAINTMRIGHHVHLRTVFFPLKKCMLIFIAQILPAQKSQDSERFERSPRKPAWHFEAEKTSWRCKMFLKTVLPSLKLTYCW